MLWIYVACDIVPELINFNRLKYKALNVEFRALDIIADKLPSGKIVFIRQVLQHLSNDQINILIPKLKATYEYIILTEHLPSLDYFEHNLDKPTGPDIRASIKSGIVLTSPPFWLSVINEQLLCEEKLDSGEIIRTTLYKIN